MKNSPFFQPSQGAREEAPKEGESDETAKKKCVKMVFGGRVQVAVGVESRASWGWWWWYNEKTCQKKNSFLVVVVVSKEGRSPTLLPNPRQGQVARCRWGGGKGST